VLGGYRKFGMKSCRGIPAHPNIECAWLDRPLSCLGTPKLQLIFAQREMKSLSFTRLEGDALETFELAYRARGRAVSLMDVYLGDSVPCGRSGVCHVD
jgi:hypothetical protein